MATINVTYHADTRLMEITQSTSNGVATTGDNNTTRIQFTFDDTGGLLNGYQKRAEFNVLVPADNSTTYKPYIYLDENDGVSLPNTILANVKCGTLPMQLAFTKTVDEEKIEFYSLNILNLRINNAINALYPTPSQSYPTVRDAIYDVQYDNGDASFTFTQLDGNTITVTLSDLREEHYEVETFDDLSGLTDAENGDSATTLDTGIWYKLYVDGNDRQWYPVAGITELNGALTLVPSFFAPTTSGTSGQYLESGGNGQPPVWVSKVTSVVQSDAVPTSRAVYIGLEAKLDDSQLITSWGDADSKATDNNIPSARLVKSLLNQHTNSINSIDSKIPSQASPSNQLADKNYVNNAITVASADFLGTFDAVIDLHIPQATVDTYTFNPTDAMATQVATAIASQLSLEPTNNDTVNITINQTQTTEFDWYWRFKFNDTENRWKFEFPIGNTAFTSAQWETIDSGLTSEDVTAIRNIGDGTVNFIDSGAGSLGSFTLNQKQDVTITVPDGSTQYINQSATFVLQDSPDYADYPYRASVPITNMTHTMFANVVFSDEQVDSGVYSSVCETYDGGVYVYANADVGTITIPTISAGYDTSLELDNVPTENSTDAVMSGGVWSAIGSDSRVVHTTGNETINGTKTFTDTIGHSTTNLVMIMRGTNAHNVIPASNDYKELAYRMTGNETNHGLITFITNATTGQGQLRLRMRDYTGGNSTDFNLYAGSDKYATAPNRTYNASNTSDIVTIGSLQSSTDVVHISGNETITGQKTFSSMLSVTGTWDNKSTQNVESSSVWRRIYYTTTAGLGNQVLTLLVTPQKGNNSEIGIIEFYATQTQCSCKWLVAGISIVNNNFVLVKTNDGNFEVWAKNVDGNRGLSFTRLNETNWGSITNNWIRDTSTKNANFDPTTYATYAYPENDGIVRTTGDQTIGGTKSWTSYLNFPRSTNGYADIILTDSVNNVRAGFVRLSVESAQNVVYLQAFKPSDATYRASQILALITKSDGTSYITGPYRTYDASNTSDIVTIGSLQSSTDVVHTTGNETIAGVKTLTSNPIVNMYTGGYSTKLNAVELGVTGNDYGWGELKMLDKNEQSFANIRARHTTALTSTISLTAVNKVNNNFVYSSVVAQVTSAGTGYVTATYRSTPSTNEEILTLGNGVTLKTAQTINGIKTFYQPNYCEIDIKSDRTNGDQNIGGLRFINGNDVTGAYITGCVDGRILFDLARSTTKACQISSQRAYDATHISDVVTIGTLQGSTDVVHTSGTETVAGQKTFTSNPVSSTISGGYTIKGTDQTQTTAPPSNRFLGYEMVGSDGTLLAQYGVASRTNGNREAYIDVVNTDTSVNSIRIYSLANSTGYATLAHVRSYANAGNPDILTKGHLEEAITIGGNKTFTDIVKISHSATTGGYIPRESNFVLQDTRYAVGTAVNTEYINRIYFTDSANDRVATIGVVKSPTNNNVNVTQTGITNFYNSSQYTIFSVRTAYNSGSGTYEKYATVNARSYNANNTDDIVNIGSLQASTDVVHTSGAETVAGVKTFTSTVKVNNAIGMDVTSSSSTFIRGTTSTSEIWAHTERMFDYNGNLVTKHAIAVSKNTNREYIGVMGPDGVMESGMSIYASNSEKWAVAPTPVPTRSAIRNITISDQAPTGGNNGDIWIQYEA